MKVGIIGCGNISRIYADSQQKFDEIEIVSCADLDLDRARELADEKGIGSVLRVDDLLADPEVEVVLNLTVPAVHGAIAIRSLLAGKHVYNEKPLALRRREARELLGLARQKNLRVGCAPDTFLGGALQTARKLIDEGAIGKPLGGTASFMARGPERWHPNPDFFYQKGGGPLFDMGPYYLTALVFLLGPVSSVSAMTSCGIPVRTVGSGERQGEEIEVAIPTHYAASLMMQEGALVQFTTSFEVARQNVPRIEIYGDGGTLSCADPNNFGGPLRLFKFGADEWEDCPLIEGGAVDNVRGIGLADMITAIREGRPHRASGRLAYHVLDTMHCIIDSADLGRHVELKSTVDRPEALALG